MWDKVVDDNLNAFEFITDHYETQEICDKAVDDYSVALEFGPHQYKTQEMCRKTITKYYFALKYCSDKYITQKKCDEAVDNFLLTLNFVPDWFVTSEMIKKLFTALFADENILYFDDDLGIDLDLDLVVFNCNETGILNKDLSCINLDDNNFDEDYPCTIIHVRPLPWYAKFEKLKEL